MFISTILVRCHIVPYFMEGRQWEGGYGAIDQCPCATIASAVGSLSVIAFESQVSRRSLESLGLLLQRTLVFGDEDHSNTRRYSKDRLSYSTPF